MLKCPNCDNTLDQDFGMVTCSACQSVLMIDMTGEVRVGTDENIPNYDYEEDDFPTNAEDDTTNPPEESFTAPDDFAPVQTLDSDVQDEDLTGEESFEEMGEDDYNGDYDPIESDVEEMVASDEEITSNFEEPTSSGFEEEEENEEALQNLSPPEESLVEEQESDSSVRSHFFGEDEEEEAESFPMASTPDPDPVDITNYANSEASSLEGGELLYDVTISRLDSKDLKDALKYVLIDEKLKLNHHEFLKNIVDGQVVIPNLNPIKAKRIVEQLQYYAVSVSWKQKRVVMDTVEPEVVESEGIEEESGEDLNA